MRFFRMKKPNALRRSVWVFDVEGKSPMFFSGFDNFIERSAWRDPEHLVAYMPEAIEECDASKARADLLGWNDGLTAFDRIVGDNPKE